MSDPPAAYAFVEGRHLRQWCVRAAAPLAVLATNGSGLVRIGALPPHDAPLGWLGLAPAVETGLRIAGIALVAAAAVLRVLAKGVLVRRTELTTGGVYRVVRHPFYLATLAGGLGTLLVSGALGAALAIAWLAAALPVFAVTARGEDAALRRIFGAAWDAWAARVPAIVPRPRLGPPGAARVAWANLVREAEPPRLLRFLAGVAAVAGVAQEGAAAWAWLAGAVAALAASHLLPRAPSPAER